MGQPAASISKVLFKASHAQSFIYGLGTLHAIKAELIVVTEIILFTAYNTYHLPTKKMPANPKSKRISLPILWVPQLVHR